MIKIHDNLKIKKTRYDFTISIDNASTFELLCEAYEMKKSDMIDLIIENFAKGNLKLKHHVQSIAEQKRALKAKCESELSLFTKSDDAC